MKIKEELMKKYLFLIIGILIITAQKVWCVSEVLSHEVKDSLKSNANEPGIMSIIFALFFVIFLIYITGLIYSKLNIVGAKTVQTQLKNYNLNKAIVLSTTQLGQNKNLHVIEINKKRFLLGATQNSINLIKELEIVEDIQIKDEIPVELPDESIENTVSSDNFDIHKKYL
jgi:flagellar biogenesis protein FliO